jgi:hypothetical protein
VELGRSSEQESSAGREKDNYKYAGSKVPNKLTKRMTSEESLKPSPKMAGPRQPVETLRRRAQVRDWKPLGASKFARDDPSVGTQPQEEQIDETRVVLVIRAHRADSVLRKNQT